MTPSYEDVRAALVTLVTAAAPTAKVHGRMRWFDTVASFTTVAKGTDGRIHVWYVTTGTPADTARLTGASLKQRVFRYELVGFMASNDADSTENLMAAECTTILDAFLTEAGRKLPGTSGVICVGMDEDGGLAVVENGGGETGHRMYPAGEGGVLCNFARITVPVRVQITA